MDACVLCKRTYVSEDLKEKHHIIPNPYRSRAKYKKRKKETISVCIDCADMIHQMVDNKDLITLIGKNIDETIENMLAYPKIQKWVEWIKDKEFGVCVKRKKRKK